ncbi:hypothetical protein BJX64DRAFT_295582 [Aspergillus heterothallicus]
MYRLNHSSAFANPNFTLRPIANRSRATSNASDFTWHDPTSRASSPTHSEGPKTTESVAAAAAVATPAVAAAAAAGGLRAPLLTGNDLHDNCPTCDKFYRENTAPITASSWARATDFVPCGKNINDIFYNDYYDNYHNHHNHHNCENCENCDSNDNYENNDNHDNNYNYESYTTDTPTLSIHPSARHHREYSATKSVGRMYIGTLRAGGPNLPALPCVTLPMYRSDLETPEQALRLEALGTRAAEILTSYGLVFSSIEACTRYAPPTDSSNTLAWESFPTILIAIDLAGVDKIALSEAFFLIWEYAVVTLGVWPDLNIEGRDQMLDDWYPLPDTDHTVFPHDTDEVKPGYWPINGASVDLLVGDDGDIGDIASIDDDSDDYYDADMDTDSDDYDLDDMDSVMDTDYDTNMDTDYDNAMDIDYDTDMDNELDDDMDTDSDIDSGMKLDTESNNDLDAVMEDSNTSIDIDIDTTTDNDSDMGVKLPTGTATTMNDDICDDMTTANDEDSRTIPEWYDYDPSAHAQAQRAFNKPLQNNANTDVDMTDVFPNLLAWAQGPLYPVPQKQGLFSSFEESLPPMPPTPRLRYLSMPDFDDDMPPLSEIVN